MNLHPINECAERAQSHVNAGATIHQQFKCDRCGAKQTMAKPNVFYTAGVCEECGGLTDIGRTGCNYMLIYSVPGQEEQRHVDEA